MMIYSKLLKTFAETIGSIKIIMLLSMILTLNLPAQQHHSSMSGIVVNNATKEKIIGANIVIIGSTFGASTDTSGRFFIPNMPPGTYDMRVSVLGFSPVIIRNVVVAASHRVEITIPLTEQSIKMSDVVTIGGRFTDLPELNVSTRFLDYREIQHTAGAFDDVLRTITILPGVAQTRLDRNDLSVRGGSAAENLYLIDGIEFENINHFGTEGSGGGTTTFLNLDFVENSFFSEGGFGVRYGDKLSSVLSIDMRDGRSDRVRGNATLSATQVGMNLDGPFAENGSFLFSARRSYLEPLFEMYDFSYAPVFYDFLGKATYRLGPSDKIEFLGIGVIDRIHQFMNTQQQRDKNSGSVFGEQNRYEGGFSYQHGFSKGLLSIAAWHSYFDFTYQRIEEGYPPMLYDHSSEAETSMKSDGVLQVFPSTEIGFGFGAKTARLLSSIHINGNFTTYKDIPKISLFDSGSDTSAYKLSGYAQLTQTLGPVVLTAGVRGDYLSMIFDRYSFSPRFSLSMYMSESTKLNASLGHYAQSPSYIWMMANSYNRGLTFMGVDQGVLGIEHHLWEDVTVTLEGYMKRYDHYPVSLTRPYMVMVNTGAEIESIEDAYTSFGLDYLQSTGTGESQGIELFIQKKVSQSPIYGRLSITYSKTQFEALDGIMRPSSFDQRWKMTVSGGYAFNENWEFNAAFHLATGRPYTPFNGDTGNAAFYRDPAMYNIARVKTNHSLDIRISRRWVTGSVVINAFADIQNVYNRKPEEPPEWNLSTMSKVALQTLGIVPSIGISVEF